jgi:kynurenine formamidase
MCRKCIRIAIIRKFMCSYKYAIAQNGFENKFYLKLFRHDGTHRDIPIHV